MAASQRETPRTSARNGAARRGQRSPCAARAKALRRRGYTVYEARDAAGARCGPQPRHQADLLLTDVVMPGLSGPNLAARLLQLNAEAAGPLHVGLHGGLPAVRRQFLGGVPLLQKPFTPGGSSSARRTPTPIAPVALFSTTASCSRRAGAAGSGIVGETVGAGRAGISAGG